MRLAHFTLERYGPFEHLALPLDPAPGRVNLIVAPNGFGKSVIRRSIGDFLFGIEARSPMTFRFGTEKMRLVADVVLGNAKCSLVRRKGNGNTLARADGTEVTAVDARRLFGGADETVFQELFGLDTALLRSGGRDLIRSQGRLGQVLFAAGGGMGRVRLLLTELEQRRDDLGRASQRHKSRPLWSALSQWERGSADLRRSALRPDGWSALELDAADRLRRLDALLHEQAAQAAERDRLRTIAACRPWLDRLHAARRVLTEAVDAPELEENFEKRWRDALEQRVKSASAATAAELDLQAAVAVRATLHFDPAWLAAAADIEALADLRGLARGAATDLPEVQRQLTDDMVKAAALRRDLGWEADVALPPAATVKDAQRRLQQQPKLAADAAAAAERLDEMDRQLAATLAELEALPAQNDTVAVVDLTALLRAGGDPGVRLDAGRRRLREAEAALQGSLAAIPDCPLQETMLGVTTAPSEARLDLTGKVLSHAEASHDGAVRNRAEQLASIDAVRTKLAHLEKTARLPSGTALRDARAHRDALWVRLCSPEVQRHVGGPPPASAVELDRAMREADHIADALIEHAQEVAEANALRTRLAALETELSRGVDALAHAAAAVAAARGELAAMARAAGGNADDMSSLRAFLRAREAAVADRVARDSAAADLADVEQDLSSLGCRLAAAMDGAMPELTALGTLLAEADRRINAAVTLSAQRKSATDQAGQQRSARATAAAAAGKAARALADWDEQWRLVAAVLRRPDAEALTASADAVARIEELRTAEAKAAGAQRRITDMQAAISSLARRTGQLQALAPELAGLPPIEAAEAFQRRLQVERQQAARCADAQLRIEQATAKLAQIAADAATAERMLSGLRAALRAATDEGAEHQLQRVRAVAASRIDAAEAARQLAVQGGGLGLESLTGRAAETTAEADAARVSEIDAGQQVRIALLDAAREASAASSAALDRAGAGMDAAEAAERREAAQAMLARTAEEALVLHASHALLQAAIDRQAEGASQPLLARIGAVFQTITGGVQAGVRIEDTREGQTMVALESDGVTRKMLDQLSEGTADQLYLALRVAALEEYAAGTTPLPFIADDVLQTFDDGRTAATLQVLLELSHRVQVIVLTHHHHVGDLAEQLADGAVQVTRLAA